MVLPWCDVRAAARNRRTSVHVPEEIRSPDLHTERSFAVSAPGGRTLRISVYDESHVTELVAETVEAIQMASAAGYTSVVSHRSGETGRRVHCRFRRGNRHRSDQGRIR